jgi:hypothetical protein
MLLSLNSVTTRMGSSFSIQMDIVRMQREGPVVILGPWWVSVIPSSTCAL